ncbi:MAG: MBL fold metallo-hydrolase [Clostridia bacterium]
MTEIIILMENKSKYGFAKEHGLSFAIIHKGNNILFDVGASDNFLINANKLDIGLSNFNDVVLSHSHWDHTNGLKYISDKRIIAHPAVFNDMFSKRTDEYIGIPFNVDKAKQEFEVLLTEKPYEIYDDIYFLGEIPRVNDFESQEAFYYDDEGNDDYVMSDSAVAIKTNEGIILITGCSHSGIINIMTYAKKVCKTEKIRAVIGGFHLRKLDKVAKETVKFLKNEENCIYYPMHCTTDEVIKYMKDELGNQQVFRKIAGESIILKDV